VTPTDISWRPTPGFGDVILPKSMIDSIFKKALDKMSSGVPGSGGGGGDGSGSSSGSGAGNGRDYIGDFGGGGKTPGGKWVIPGSISPKENDLESSAIQKLASAASVEFDFNERTSIEATSHTSDGVEIPMIEIVGAATVHHALW
jgi:hypothetical protein